MSETVDRLVWVVARLREHCPWTRRLTHGALGEYLVEEAYEAVEVIESGPAGAWGDEALRDGTYERLRLELGDVLFQVVLHAAIATDAGGFDLDGTAEAITAKMIRRNPHVFHPDGTLRDPEDLAAATIADVERTWERVKRLEREAAGTAAAPDGTAPGGTTPGGAAFADLPASLPALAAAAKVVDRAARQPVDPLPAPGPPPSGPAGEPLADEAALGAELFRLVRHARAGGLDPERALRRHLAAVRRDLEAGTPPRHGGSGPAASG
ncbi:tetrapyrrole methyltransferase [Citricoccus sp. SGAir0253]|uniref:MazG nucleotide pyrophosphohydrolase domain-containing protein n=1 Tax=Citricoccus sp. SGAir0253 TaxID=2567881 RepID=UPI0010CD574F|nr:MazG nucleotide pyrophosphohydrolase domain-containing protein [Citricoccus sp. SGAir0253]QCU78684.1 tetrapyrrole methyltransferase [Citricoccus sp. SGAir0253]